MKRIITILSFFYCLTFGQQLLGQHLHAVGKEIHDAEGNNFIIRSMGLGGWMLQEGYLLQTAGVLGTQWEYRAKLEEMIGEEKTQEFYDAWLENHFTKRDLDSLKAWGFNTVRVPLHYNLFTLPIEEEPVLGEQTWLTKGFEMTDELLSWCQENEMYLIFDLHAAPGGQGTNADISDYDPSKPSLWESEHNRDKMVALWGKIAERYGAEAWIGGYDLLNETNWTFASGNNSMMLELYKNCTDIIRSHDQRNIIYIEGNSWANDFSGLTPPWDDNMAYSFHKYWTYNSPTDLDWVLWMRDEFNVPLWLGETGENSNTWFTDLINLCENNNVGWSWWPHKKAGINNPMQVTTPKEYEDLIKYWKGEITQKPTEEEVFNAVMAFAEAFKIENVTFKRDVVDAMFRQPYTDETIPYVKHDLTSPIFFSDYDLGKNGFAYFDNNVANYGGNGGQYSDWNTGWSYRNDGVDIQGCDDEVTNGYNVGWTESGEWMQYTFDVSASQLYDLTIRSASGTNNAAIIELQLDGVKIGNDLALSNTGGWETWKSTTFENYVISEGQHTLKVLFKRGGSNLNYFEFVNPRALTAIETDLDKAFTDELGKYVYVTLNKDWDTSVSLDPSDFEIVINNSVVSFSEVNYVNGNNRALQFSLDNDIQVNDVIYINVKENNLLAEDGTTLSPVSQFVVTNNKYQLFEVPGKIYADKFYFNNGFELEKTNDTEGENNLSYANEGDYVDYKVNILNTGYHELEYRVSTERDENTIEVLVLDEMGIPKSITKTSFGSTNGWQSWKTIHTIAHLEAGEYTLRFRVDKGEYNINWFNFNYKLNEPLAIPGKIEAEFFTQNNGLHLENCEDEGNGYNLSYTDPGDFVEYNVAIETEGVYRLNYRAASSYNDAGKVKMELIPEEGDIIEVHTKAFANTGGWQEWMTFTEDVKLPAGNYTLKVTVEESSFNLNWIEFIYKPTTPFNIPGKAQVEDNYFSKDIDLEVTADIGGGLNLSKPKKGSYFEFIANVAKSGTYDISFRVASPFNNAGELEIYSVKDDLSENLIHTQQFENTGGWQEWETLSSTIVLEEGEYNLKFVIVTSGFNLNWIELKEHKDDVTSVRDDLLSNVKIFPNPTNGTFSIQLNNTSQNEVRIFNSNTNLILSEQSNGSVFHYNLTDFPSGIYFVQITNKYSNTIKKIIKK